MNASEDTVSRSIPTQVVVLIAVILLCVGIGAVGALVTLPQIPTWYAGIAKPSWTPPNKIFGPVWTTLYVMMAVAVWLVWRRERFAVIWPALSVFGVQLILNAIWSPIFFGLESPLLGLLVIVPLWLMIGVTIYCFSRRNIAAAMLLIPYFLWVSYATCLNFAIWRLNG
ncbi:TspO/MBR family protein [Blastopirellula marina]|uniref:Sensory protein TspO n=1 Tax=Blastopirellula marina TaxID=124 RepID=A0A2S8F2C6_9BACT|nr:TspO/MBR family protein [Blastopirellula marina]PQO26293.1 sensory protein TspO [Blastopirellula marina]PQO47173.1 sensory protein TspO [Blastopirellula marina]PTL40693.1 tryptophan-rich sensory protein [Blastopirellula marina]